MASTHRQTNNNNHQPPTTIGTQVVAEIPTPADPKEYELMGTLFKRRGGIGRILGWKPRLFTLYKGA